ncbi:hypothetical protein MRY88_15935 [Bacillus cereus]|uniref:NERD domain-containing protein n=3 Tax=Bacillus cereus TaxID=1396 RepID=A0A158RG74_BACC3|nr:hypothetical protein [Bacillus cereus]ACO25971.1 hypothetical protein BCA_3280 [Bacillus cereus 03BB102]AJG56003.1 hypothetical protein AS54_3270 [Bacillus cereus 03BB102]QPR84261.1 hypothetical protein I6G75_05725 [Bacillus cereus]
MWECVQEIEQLLNRKKYNEALKIITSRIEQLIKEERQEEINTVIRKKMLFLNMSGDANQTSLFCEKLINFCMRKDLNLMDYAHQCQVLNKELDWYGERYKLIVSGLYSLDPYNALHVILNVFENINHQILGTKPTELERVYYGPYVYNMESEFESGISALNRMLGLWLSGCQRGAFTGKFKGDFSIEKSELDLQKQIAPIVRAVDYLEWICKEISLQQVALDENESEVTFTIQDIKEYYRYKLPYIRETSRMHSFFLREEKFSRKIKEIDYSRIVKVKDSGDDFKLIFTIDILLNQLKNSIEVAYKNNLLIIQDMYITNMDEIHITNKSITVYEAFIFYHCIRTFALIYFEATQYFIENVKKKPRAPFLALKRKDIYKYLHPILSKLLNRRVNEEQINEFISLFTFGNDNINDLYYKPLIVFRDNVILNPSIFIMNNFSKTFLNHMSVLDVNLAERGDTFELVVQKLFEDNGFNVYKEKYPFSYKYENKSISGDIDLIARKGDYLYVGQLKNRLEPLEPQDYRGADKKIKIGVKQSDKTLLYIQRNPEEFCKRIGIELQELKRITIKPFVLVSCFYGSGQIIEDIPIIDMSALTRFLDEGQIRVYPGDGEPFVYNLRTQGDVIPEEFNDFLIKPYFLESNIYGMQLATHHAFPIQDRKFVLRSKENWQENFNNSFLSTAVEHFFKNGVIRV